MPPIASRRRPFRPHFMHLFRLVLARSRSPSESQAIYFLAHLPFGPPGRPRGPLPPSNCAKIAGAGASLAAARRPGWATLSPKPPTKRGELAARPPRICFSCASWVPACSSRRRSLLSARLDEIALPPAAQSEPFWGSFGPSGRPRGPAALSRPATAQNSLGRGRSPLRPPCAAARRPGWAMPSPKPKTKPRLLQKIAAVQARRTPLC
jgi:hypothetical protein